MNFGIVRLGKGNDAAYIKVIAVVFDAQWITALHLLDELAPPPHESSAPLAHEMLRITVLAEIVSHLSVRHTQSAPRFKAWRWK